MKSSTCATGGCRHPRVADCGDGQRDGGDTIHLIPDVKEI